MRRIGKYFFDLLPSKMRETVLAHYKGLVRDKVIKEWTLHGKPVPVPHAIKQITIETYQKKYKTEILIETGTYRGDMVFAQRNNFRQIISIELSNDLFLNAKNRFKGFDHIRILQGDSGNVLKEVVPFIDKPALFWLDGHYSGGITALGEKACPIYEELSAVLINEKMNHVLLVDDARLFNGTGDYPTIEALFGFVKSKNAAYAMSVEDDIIRLTVGG